MTKKLLLCIAASALLQSKINAQCTFTPAITASGSATICAGTPITFSAMPAGDSWVQKADFTAAAARIDLVSFSIGSKGYMGTGSMSNGTLMNDFWEYDPATDAWTQKADVGTAGRSRAAGFSTATKGYISTGLVYNVGFVNDLLEFDPAMNTWTPKASLPADSRGWPAAFTINNKCYLGTGYSFMGDNLNDFWEYDPATDIWTQKANVGGLVRYVAGGFAIGNKGYIGLGYNDNAVPGNLDDIREYDPATDTWTQKNNFGGTGRRASGYFVIGNKAYVTSGFDNTTIETNDLWEYNQASDTWAQKASLPGSIRRWPVSFSIGNTGYMGLGGVGTSNTFFTDFWAYTPSYTYSWSTGATSRTITPALADTYSVTVTDVTGCSASASLVLVVNPNPTLTIAGPGTVCSGSSATLTASGASTYTWSANAASATGTAVTVTPAIASSYSVTGTSAAGCTATAVKAVNVAVLTATIAKANVNCNGAATGSAAVTASGGTVPYSYTWTASAGSNSTAVNLAAGNYTSTVADANGCSINTTFTITQPSAIVVNSTVTPILCNGGAATITLTASGGTSPYTGTGTFTVSAGVHSYTITDANSCTSVKSLTVTQPAALTATTTASSILCNGGAASVTLAASGGTSPYTGAGTFTTLAGTPNYTITDANACTVVKSVTVTQPSALTATATASSILCNGGAASVTLAASGGTSPYTGAGTFTTLAGTPNYTITDANACTVVKSVTVTQPAALTVTATASAILCNGGVTTITVSASGGTSPYTGAGTFTNLAGTHNYTITDANSCTSVKSITVAQPAVIAVTETTSAVLCNGGVASITLAATGGTSPYTGTGTYTTLAGTHNYTITDANACTSVKTITVTEPSALTVSATASAILCYGKSTTVTVSAAGGTSPYTGAGTYTALAGTHDYTVSDANGCAASASITLSQPAAIVSTQTFVLCAGRSVTVGTHVYNATGIYTTALVSVNGCDSTVTTDLTVKAVVNTSVTVTGITIAASLDGASYQWIDCDNAKLPVTGATSQSFTPTANGNYAVIVTFNGCADTSACTNISTVGLARQTGMNSNIKVYPNPGNGVFTVESASPANITVTDMTGRVILNDKLTAAKQSFSLQNESNGIYFVTINANGQQRTIKLVKE